MEQPAGCSVQSVSTPVLFCRGYIEFISHCTLQHTAVTGQAYFGHLQHTTLRLQCSHLTRYTKFNRAMLSCWCQKSTNVLQLSFHQSEPLAWLSSGVKVVHIFKQSHHPTGVIEEVAEAPLTALWYRTVIGSYRQNPQMLVWALPLQCAFNNFAQKQTNIKQPSQTHSMYNRVAQSRKSVLSHWSHSNLLFCHLVQVF